MNSIKIINGKLNIKREYLESIRKVLMGTGPLNEIYHLNHFLEKEGNPIPIDQGDFLSFSESFVFKGELALNKELAEKSSKDLRCEYEAIQNKFISIRGVVHRNSREDSFCESMLNKCIDIDSMIEYENLFSIIMELLEIKKKIYKRRDLFLAKDKIYESLKYIFTEEQLTLYQNRCNELFNLENIDLIEAENYLKEAQSFLLENWKKEVTSIDDFIPGKPFKFICHSTNSMELKGDFFSRYVSASLLTEEFTETYHNGYGFIFSPDKIVGADSNDMYVHNSSSNSEDIINGSSLPPICPPNQIIDLCRQKRKENKKNGVKEKIYSEVVIDGFNPQAIFCITNGSKLLNHNYRNALELQKQFSNLKIIEIDLTLYKEYNELKAVRNTLIKSIEMQIDSEYYKKSDTNYDLYELFWQKYLELKSKSEYQESDIIDLYRVNKEILSISLSIDKLFSSKYDDTTIRYALLKNCNFNIESIFNGNFDIWSIRKLQTSIGNYNSNEILNKHFPNIDVFLSLSKKITMTDEILTAFKARKPITFESMIEILQTMLKLQKSVLLDETSNLINDKQVIERAIEKKETEYKKNERYEEIINAEFYYSLAILDYDREADAKNANSLEEQETEQKKLSLETDLNDKRKIKDNYLNHRIINYFKLKKINTEIKKLENSILVINTQISEIRKRSIIIENMINTINSYFISKVGCSLSEYSELLEEATILYNSSIRVEYAFEIFRLKRKLEELDAKINQLLEKEQEVDNNIELIESTIKVA